MEKFSVRIIPCSSIINSWTYTIWVSETSLCRKVGIHFFKIGKNGQVPKPSENGQPIILDEPAYFLATPFRKKKEFYFGELKKMKCLNSVHLMVYIKARGHINVRFVSGCASRERDPAIYCYFCAKLFIYYLENV